MKLKIPDDERAIVDEWLVKGNDRTQALLDALDKVKPAIDRATLAMLVSEASKIDLGVVGDVLKVLLNLARTVARWDDDDEVLSSIFNSVVGEGESTLRDGFEARIRRVLASKAVEITSKARSVMRDNPNRFCSARTLTELRPIFSEKDLKAEAGIIVHQLKLVYHSGPEDTPEEIFVTLDRDDLDTLKKMLDRATRKHDELARVATGVELLDRGRS